MSILDRFIGAGVQRPLPPADASTDDQALARYRYLLRTAPPETIEQAHAEAFARLTPEQRRRLLAELANDVPDRERPAVERLGDDPQGLARLATRAEIRQPGTLERVFGGVGGGLATSGGGLGGLMAGSFVSSMAGTVLGSMIAQHFMSSHASAGLLGDEAGLATANDPFHTADGLGSGRADQATPLADTDVASSDADPFSDGASTGGGSGFDDGGGFDGGGFDGGGFDT